MKVSILGSKTRGIVWEKHLRKLSVVREVVVTSSLSGIDRPDAVIILDDSDSNLQTLLECIKQGFHSYLVSRIPIDTEIVKKIYHTSEEANVAVQFSHWPTFSSSAIWMKKQIPRPDFFQIKKVLSTPHPEISTQDFHHAWIDEIALVLKWMGGHTHRIEARAVCLKETYTAMAATLLMEDGSLASLQFSIAAAGDLHQRMCANSTLMLDCDVVQQKVFQHTVNDTGRIVTATKNFDPADTAQHSVTQFIRAIQTSAPTAFTPYDIWVTANVCRQIMVQLHKA